MTPSAYRQAAQAYAAGVRELFTPPHGARRGAIVPDLAGQAEALAPLAAAHTRAAAAQLAVPDPAGRLEAADGLLAQVLADLEVGAALLAAAEAGAAPASRRAARAAAGPATSEDLNEALDILGGVMPASRRTRAAAIPATVAEARIQLNLAAVDALTAIRDRAARTGQSALGGLLGLGVGELAAAAGVVGMEVAAAVGQAEQVGRLVALAREFVLSAYQSLVALIGPALAQTAVTQAASWVNDAITGEKFGQLVERLYHTGQTRADVEARITASQAELVRFITTIQQVETLIAGFQRQTSLAERALRGLKLIGGIPASALPQGRLLLGAAYLLLGSYILLAGADFVDASQFRLLGRTPGVRVVIEQGLA
jgi:hypothetical protein